MKRILTALTLVATLAGLGLGCKKPTEIGRAHV